VVKQHGSLSQQWVLEWSKNWRESWHLWDRW